MHDKMQLWFALVVLDRSRVVTEIDNLPTEYRLVMLYGERSDGVGAIANVWPIPFRSLPAGSSGVVDVDHHKPRGSQACDVRRL
jgi:hypothetical protein